MSSRLTAHQLVGLSTAHARQVASADLLLICAPEATTQLTRELQRIGEVLYCNDIGYLRVRVGHRDLHRVLTHPLVEDFIFDGGRSFYSDLDPDPMAKAEVMARADATMSPGTDPEAPDDAPLLDASVPALNPFVPTRDVGAPQFVEAHPSWDGRGVVIGVVESMPDARHPVFSGSLDASGEPISKFTGLWTTRSPGERDASTVEMQLFEAPNHPGVVLPYDGEFRLGFYDKGVPPTALLWDARNGRVWAAPADNKDFSATEPGRDFSASGELVHLSVEVSVAIRLHPDEGVISLHRPSPHSTGGSAIAAGAGFFGGPANGTAPAAQLAVFHAAGPEAHHLLEALMLAAQDPKVDVISCSTGFSAPPEHGRSLLAKLVSRLADAYDKLIVVAAGNSGLVGLGASHDLAAADSVLAVGGSAHRQTLEAKWGPFESDLIDFVHPLSSRGPAGDGGMKPDVVAPCLQVAATLHGAPPHNELATHRLPPGYRVVAGTSYAAPLVAGCAALLISAARQEGVAFSADRLRWALRAGARFLSGWGGHEQGAGLVDVAEAWRLLSGSHGPLSATVVAPVRHGLADSLPSPGFGRGIYDRSGLTPGDSCRREVRLAVEPADVDREWRTRWLGNDGTFAARQVVELSAGSGHVAFEIGITPRAAGVSSAVLSLAEVDDGPGVLHVLVTAVAVDSGNPAPQTLEPFRARSVFLHVPGGTSRLEVRLSVNGGEMTQTLGDPLLEHDFFKWIRNPRIFDRPPTRLGPGEWVRSVTRPDPGIWEFRLDHQLADPTAHLVGALGVTMARSDTDMSRSTTPTCTKRRTVYATLDEPGTWDFDVEHDAELLTVMADESAVALFLFHQANARFHLWDYSACGRNPAGLVARRPPAGVWRVVVLPLEADGRTEVPLGIWMKSGSAVAR